ncbi:hypothetical protein Emag_003546 [Eimeria magna]
MLPANSTERDVQTFSQAARDDSPAAAAGSGSSDDEPQLLGVSLPAAVFETLQQQQQQQQKQQKQQLKDEEATPPKPILGIQAMSAPSKIRAPETATGAAAVEPEAVAAAAAKAAAAAAKGGASSAKRARRLQTHESIPSRPVPDKEGPEAIKPDQSSNLAAAAAAAAAADSTAASGSAAAAAAADRAAADTAAAAAAAGGSLTEVVVRGLRELAELYEQQGEAWRSVGFRKAAAVVAAACSPTRTTAATASVPELRGGLTRSNLQQLAKLPGVGRSVLRTIEEIAARGSSSRKKVLQQDPAAAAALQQLQLIHGVGPKTARAWHARGLTLHSLRQAQQQLQQLQQQLLDLHTASSGSSKKQALKGAAAKKAAALAAAAAAAAAACPLSREQLVGLRYAEAFAVKIPRAEVSAIAAFVRRLLLHTPCSSSSSSSNSSNRSSSSSDIDVSDCLCCSCCGASCNSYFDSSSSSSNRSNSSSSSSSGIEWRKAFLEVMCCGSYRRGRAECGDVDLLLMREDSWDNAKLISRVVELLRGQGLILDDLQLKSVRGHQEGETPNPAAAAAAAAADGSSDASEESERETPAAPAAPAAAAPAAAAPAAAASSRRRVVPLVSKEKGFYEYYFGVCCWPPMRPGAPHISNSSSSSSSSSSEERPVYCSAAAAGLASCPAGLDGCPVCAGAWGGPRLARRIDLKVYPRRMRAPALMYFTGSALFNRSSRAWAKGQGFSLDETGLYTVTRGGNERQVWGRVLCETEADIFETLNLQFLPPDEREGTAVPLRAAPR